MLFNATELVGLVEPELAEFQGQRVRADVLPALIQLQRQAQEAGFELAVASGYRSFARQQRIWDQKAQGQLPLLSDAGETLNFGDLTVEQTLFAILRWSALPGGSRHHWGTDFDVYDAGALEAGQRVQLTFAETVNNGPFARLHRWLDEYLSQADCPFFRPYTRPTGGVAPEPWHLSYAPVAAVMQGQFHLEQLHAIVQRSDIALKGEVIGRLPDIFERYVWVPWELYPERYRPDEF